MIQIPEVLSKIIDLALREGVESINEYPGCWYRKVDERWEFWMNAHGETIDTEQGVSVPPYEVYVQYNGWPAGFVGPSGGIIASGPNANEDAFIAALEGA